jgi:hypothetical protein
MRAKGKAVSTPYNDLIIEEALEVAAQLDEITAGGHLKTAQMYIKDGELDRLDRYLFDMKLTLRADNEVAHNYAQEIY